LTESFGLCVPLRFALSSAGAKRPEQLASDPASSGKVTYRSMQKALAALELKKAGLLSAPVRRDPTGAIDFIDGCGMSWNAYDFGSKLSSHENDHGLRISMIEIGVDLLSAENVILITENLSSEVTNELKTAVGLARLGNRVLLWPGVSTSS
jgi:hypothetical protein